MNRDGIPDVLQQPQTQYVSTAAPAVFAAPAAATAHVQYASPAPAVYAAPAAQAITVTGVDMNRDGIPDVLQHSHSQYVTTAAPVVAAHAPIQQLPGLPSYTA